MRKLLPVALSIAGVAFIGQSTIAAPDPIFNPALAEIKQKMPKGWEVRLPSRVGFSDRRNLYPNSVFFTESSQEFFVVLYGIPNCVARACTVGSIVSGRDSNQSYAHMLMTRPIFSESDTEKLRVLGKKKPSDWTKADQELFNRSEQGIILRESITLKPGVKGLFVANRGMGASTPPSSSVVWRQGSFTYRVSMRGCFSKSNALVQPCKTAIINTAISMAKELPIEPD